MNIVRKRRLMIVIFALFGLCVAIALILYALRAQTDYFYTPAQIASGAAPSNKRIKAGGMVVKGSLKKQIDSLSVSFQITDFKSTVDVRYTGILPDLFKEGSGVVGTGEMHDGVFFADEILAKHDENYMPPDVTAALKAQGRMSNGELATPQNK
ncbi:cytochrome c maturation protein CcmE [Aquirhabdus parva]|uniref:Cytochrome c-type biogenesis protein CcmE n=1 Tax=Aquirhabdus parva TaxID=2283318 RepID=A0A345P6I0_9GAMM|nr:cytochrome c maturation protein CcmE [Aquirhabdus parva]AXI02889.1 cytochrome c maturation protein CcmE [Aquirhabdus parva]